MGSIPTRMFKFEHDFNDSRVPSNILSLVFFYNIRLIELTTRHRQETDMETERLRTAQLQSERMLEARERAHRQRVKALEDQVGQRS